MQARFPIVLLVILFFLTITAVLLAIISVLISIAIAIRAGRPLAAPPEARGEGRLLPEAPTRQALPQNVAVTCLGSSCVAYMPLPNNIAVDDPHPGSLL